MPENLDPAAPPPASPAEQNPVTLPLVFNDSKIQAQVAAGMAALGILTSFGTAILGFVATKDLVGAINFLRSAPALPGLALILGIILFVHRQIKVRKRVAVGTALVQTVSNEVAVLKSEVLAPAVLRAPEPETGPVDELALTDPVPAAEADDTLGIPKGI